MVLLKALVVIGLGLISGAGFADDATIQAKFIYSRLTSLTPRMQDTLLIQMRGLIEAGQALEAAKLATNHRAFYETTVLNMVAPWSSTDGSAANRFDDMQALALGLIRDRADFRIFLNGKLGYRASPDVLPYPPYRPDSNFHFESLASSGHDIAKSLVSFERLDGRSIGAFGSRGFGRAYYDGGTNRRAVKFAIEHFLCKSISGWREPNLPEDFIRRDVNRIPAGKISEYHEQCRGCHAPMDAMTGAFARMDYVNDAVSILSEGVSSKYNINPTVFPEGFVTIDERWTNYLSWHQNVQFGFRGKTSGRSLEEFGAMLTNSRAFSQCMVSNAVASVCSSISRRDEISSALVPEFESNGYDLRHVFELASIDPKCR